MGIMFGLWFFCHQFMEMVVYVYTYFATKVSSKLVLQPIFLIQTHLRKVVEWLLNKLDPLHVHMCVWCKIANSKVIMTQNLFSLGIYTGCCKIFAHVRSVTVSMDRLYIPPRIQKKPHTLQTIWLCCVFGRNK